MKKIISIDPVTRLEGNGRIDILLDKNGNVNKSFFRIPELRGFEKFCEGRPVEEMPRITSRICGVCPTAHHMASAKALDSLYHVKPTETAKKIRELMYNTFIFEDHIFHFYFLGGPDFIIGPESPKSERNIFGVLNKVGKDIVNKVIEIRKQCRHIISTIGGKVVQPVCGLPGGVSKKITEDDRKLFLKIANNAIDFAIYTLKIFKSIILKNKNYLDLIQNDIYYNKTYYMGLVDNNNRLNFYDGNIRIIDPEGKEFVKFKPKDYLDVISEHVESWTYSKFPFLKNVGWNGFVDGNNSGVVRVAPLARLNVADGLATPYAQGEYEKMYKIFGSKPIHNTLAYHWARLIEILYAAERMHELANDYSITDENIRNISTEKPDEGIGIVEAPRGTLIHHYKTDYNGIITKANLIVATVLNSAAINISITKAAKNFIKKGKVNDGLLNMIELAFRAYDPCLACATHSFEKFPLIINIYNFNKKIIKKIKNDENYS